MAEDHKTDRGALLEALIMSRKEIEINVRCMFSEYAGVDQSVGFVVKQNQGLPFMVTVVCSRAQRLLPIVDFPKTYKRILFNMVYDYFVAVGALDVETVAATIKNDPALADLLSEVGALESIVDQMESLRLSTKEFEAFTALNAGERTSIYCAAALWLMLANNQQIYINQLNTVSIPDIFKDHEEVSASFELMISLATRVAEHKRLTESGKMELLK